MTLASEVDVQRQRLNDAAVQFFNRQVVTAVETFLVDNEFNQAFDLTGRDTTAGAVAGACAFDVGVSRAPQRPAAWAVGDPYYNLSNYGTPYPFPNVVKSDENSLLTGQVPKALSGSNNGCRILYDGINGYGVASQSISNNVTTLYNGHICNWKANEAGDGLLEDLPADPKLWA